MASTDGGFRSYAGSSIASLIRQGKDLHLANPSFNAVEGLTLDAWLAPDVTEITPDTALHQSYRAQELVHRASARW